MSSQLGTLAKRSIYTSLSLAEGALGNWDLMMAKSRNLTQILEFNSDARPFLSHNLCTAMMSQWHHFLGVNHNLLSVLSYLHPSPAAHPENILIY